MARLFPFTLGILVVLVICSRLSAEDSKAEFIDAVTSGDEKKVTAMIEKTAALAKATNAFGVPVLVLSLGNQKPAIVELLCKHGADPNDRGKGATPPMGMAVIVKLDPREMKALLNAGGNANYTSEAFGQTPLMKIAQAGDLETVQLLVSKKAEVNKSDKVLKWSVLHYAAVGANADIVKFLIKNGAKIDVVDKDGKTALSLVLAPGKAPWAKGKDYAKVIAALRDAGAK